MPGKAKIKLPTAARKGRVATRLTAQKWSLEVLIHLVLQPSCLKAPLTAFMFGLCHFHPVSDQSTIRPSTTITGLNFPLLARAGFSAAQPRVSVSSLTTTKAIVYHNKSNSLPQLSQLRFSSQPMISVCPCFILAPSKEK